MKMHLGCSLPFKFFTESKLLVILRKGNVQNVFQKRDENFRFDVTVEFIDVLVGEYFIAPKILVILCGKMEICKEVYYDSCSSVI
jgi:hypothetical protein